MEWAKSASGSHAAPEPSIPLENQDREFGVGGKFRDPDGVPPQDPLPISRRVRPAPEPHHLWRRPDGGGEFIEVRVGGHDNETSGPCELPYLRVGALQQACVCDVKRIRV